MEMERCHWFGGLGNKFSFSSVCHIISRVIACGEAGVLGENAVSVSCLYTALLWVSAQLIFIFFLSLLASIYSQRGQSKYQRDIMAIKISFLFIQRMLIGYPPPIFVGR